MFLRNVDKLLPNYMESQPRSHRYENLKSGTEINMLTKMQDLGFQRHMNTTRILRVVLTPPTKRTAVSKRQCVP
jgi:hypothetical protein